MVTHKNEEAGAETPVEEVRVRKEDAKVRGLPRGPRGELLGTFVKGGYQVTTTSGEVVDLPVTRADGKEVIRFDGKDVPVDVVDEKRFVTIDGEKVEVGNGEFRRIGEDAAVLDENAAPVAINSTVEEVIDKSGVAYVHSASGAYVRQFSSKEDGTEFKNRAKEYAGKIGGSVR